MNGRPKVRFIIPLWGKRYIEEFSEVCLPTHLAHGNLPYLAEHTDLAVRVMTTAESRPYFDRSPTFKRLQEFCRVEFIEIDDLVTRGMYGVTLTLAYARAVQASGDAQTDTWFILMNSDFALADGGMRTVVDKICEGRRCLLAPSLRACAEPAYADLREQVDPRRHSLVAQPRDLVSLAFRHLHPTALAKTLTQNLVACTTYNQMYWQVDANTLLGRYHLIFPLAIRPDWPLGDVNSYVDYGFIPELVPSDDFEVLGDSDDFFMLELQPTEQEKEFLFGGEPTVKGIANELARWTTREHRMFAQWDAVFHTADLPDGLDRVRDRADGYVRAVQAAMPEPIDHVDHYYWYFGVQSWVMQSRLQGMHDAKLPGELGKYTVASYLNRRIGRGRTSLSGRLKDRVSPWLARVRSMLGSMPNVSVLHRYWLDSEVLKHAIADVRAAGAKRPLLIATAGSGAAALWSTEVGGETAWLTHIPEHGLPGDGYDRILVSAEDRQVDWLGTALTAATARLAPGGRVQVIVGPGPQGAIGWEVTSEVAAKIERVLPPDWFGYETTTRFVGGNWKKRLRSWEVFFLSRVPPVRIADLPFFACALVAWPAIAALIAAHNLANRARQPQARHPDYVSTVLVTFQPRPETQRGTAPALKRGAA